MTFSFACLRSNSLLLIDAGFTEQRTNQAFFWVDEQTISGADGYQAGSSSSVAVDPAAQAVEPQALEYRPFVDLFYDV